MKDIEKNLKNRFQGQSIPVDKNESEELWVGISKGLNPQPVTWYGNLSFAKIFLAIGAGAIMTFSLYYLTSTNNSATAFSSEIQPEKITQSKQSIISKNDLTTNTENKAELNTENSNKSSSDSQNNINSNGEPLAKTSNQKTDSKSTNAYLAYANHSDGVGIASSDFTYKVNSQSDFQFIDEINTTKIVNHGNRNTDRKDENISKTTIINTPSNKLNNDLLTNETSSFKLLSFLPIQLLPSSTKENFKELIKNPKEIEIKKNSRWSAEVFGGTNFINFDYHSAEKGNLANLKNSTDKIFLGHQFGINLGYRLSPKAILQTGINYQSSWSKLDHEFINTEPIQKRNQLIKVWLDANTLDTLNRQTVDTVVNLTTTHKVVHFNKYEKLSIPLMLGFQKDMRRFSFILFAGPTFNFYTNQSGRQIDDEGSLSIISNDEDPVFKRFQLGASAKLGFYYHWSDHLDLFISPQFSYQSNRLFDDAFGLRAYQFQGNVGLRYRL